MPEPVPESLRAARTPPADFVNRLLMLKRMKKQGLITEEDCHTKKKQLLENSGALTWTYRVNVGALNHARVFC